MTSEETEEQLNRINEQIGELFELMEKERKAPLVIKAFKKVKETRYILKKKWVLACLLLSLGLTVGWMVASEEFTYNVYFVFLSFIRLILIKVRPSVRVQSKRRPHRFVQILPLWDWTVIYTNPCFVYNPFYNNSLALSECDVSRKRSVLEYTV